MSQPKDDLESNWTVFVGCMFVGLGIGVLVGEAVGGILLGMGAGFLLMTLLPYLKK